jgi:hypothetical protein
MIITGFRVLRENFAKFISRRPFALASNAIRTKPLRDLRDCASAAQIIRSY